MADISLEAVTGKLNRVGYEAFMQALRHAKSAGHRNVELAHWLFHILQKNSTDISLTADHYKLDRAKLLAEIGTQAFQIVLRGGQRRLDFLATNRRVIDQ